MVDRDRGGRRAFGVFVPDETPEYVAAHTEWCLALGGFLHTFAATEHHLRLLLFRYTRVTEVVGRALFHSDRVAELKDAINRVLEATGRWDEKDGLDPFFSHLSLISSVRNNLVHWGGHQLESGDYIVSNLHLAPIDRGRGHRVSAADIRAMTEDLSDISAAILIARERGKVLGKVRFPLPYQLPDAWKFRPRPLPPLARPRPPKRPLEQANPRAASQKKQKAKAPRPKPEG
ncbi:hypothetical protein [Phenylobacterium sp.]|uniref:hypothetical protein n=1 Tax=Phenylobacterium sp. TaxID=1871053 RepID=UPI002720D0DD|nr:hypothetical protein [Phenylobacterium sp.]MDO8799036.1 hypothetical protein [Phenylobacterium sp.]